MKSGGLSGILLSSCFLIGTHLTGEVFHTVMVELLLFFRYTLDSSILCKGGKNMNRQVDFLIYRSAEEELSVNALVKDESIWLTQKAMAELFAVEVLSLIHI